MEPVVEVDVNALDPESRRSTKGQWSQENDTLRNFNKPTSVPPPGGFTNMHFSAQRQVSGPQAANGLTVPSPNSGAAGASAAMSPLSPAANGVQHLWGNSVVAGAPAVGKSSQFIDRLQNENATLRREYNVEKSAKEEAQKSLTTSKAIETKLIAENSRLELLQSTNSRAIERKNRKIDELRASLDAEIERRKGAEAREQQMATELDNTHAETNKAMAEAFTAQKRAEANADALRDGLHRLQTRYERQVQNMAKDLAALKTRQQEDRARLLALEVSGDQRGQEIGHTDELVERMQNLMLSYKVEQEEWYKNIEAEAEKMRDTASKQEENGERLLSEMAEARDRMKWVVGVEAARKK